MKKLFLCSLTSTALVAAGALYAQEGGAGVQAPGVGASAQAGPGGASAQAGGAAAGAGTQGAAAQAGAGDAAAGASTQQGAAAQAGPAGAEAGVQSGADAGLQANPPPAPQLEGQAGAAADASGSASAGADANRPALGVTLSGSGENLTINSVQPGSPAAQAGLQPSDQIISFNGEEVASTQAFVDTVRGADVNGSGELIILRNGERQTLNVNFMPWNQVYSGQPYFAMRPNFDAGPGAVGQPGYGAGYGPGYAAQGYGGGVYGGACCDPCATGAVYTSHYSYGWSGHGRRARHRGCW
jgi:membrane-associated protease RseP (regulator of RpoE activity)